MIPQSHMILWPLSHNPQRLLPLLCPLCTLCCTESLFSRVTTNRLHSLPDTLAVRWRRYLHYEDKKLWLDYVLSVIDKTYGHPYLSLAVFFKYKKYTKWEYCLTILSRIPWIFYLIITPTRCHLSLIT